MASTTPARRSSSSSTIPGVPNPCDARRDPGVAQLQRHRAGEMLAVAALRARDEVDEGRNSMWLRRMLVVDEAAAGAEPGLERDRRRVGALGPAGDLQCGLVQRA